MRLFDRRGIAIAQFQILLTLFVGSFFVRPLVAADAPTAADLKQVEAKSKAAAEKIVAATVGIINQSLATNGRLGEGSGVVVSEDGLVLTAGHVIGQPGYELTVVFPDGRRAAAKGIGVNFARDAGLARITEPGKWPHVEMGRSADITPGTWCLATGHPGGIQLGRTPPIRLGRVLNSGKSASFLDTDATVISGDSGGPLFNLEGRVIGIHSNIGMNVNQNQDVPVDVYRDTWAELSGTPPGKSADKAQDKPSEKQGGDLPNPEKLERFRALLFQREQAGDVKVRDYIKDGRLLISAEEVDRLIVKWEQMPLKGKVGERLPSPPVAIRGVALALAAGEYGKSSPLILHNLAPIAAVPARSTVQIFCDGKPAALGTVVRKDGLIVTKMSEMHGRVTCRIGGRELPASLVKVRNDYDLELVKVEATELVPVAWAEGDPPRPGSVLISVAPEKGALELGIVGVAAREIPDAPKIMLRNRAVAGVTLDEAAKDARLKFVHPDLPAAKAGLLPGDVILIVGGQPTATYLDVNRAMGKYRPGDKVTFEISRDGKALKIAVELASSERLAPKMTGEKIARLSEAGGTISKRQNKFPIAFTHDTVLQAAQCGGPVIDLDGRVVGLNIARADRTASYAIPASVAGKAVEELMPEVKSQVPNPKSETNSKSQ